MNRNIRLMIAIVLVVLVALAVASLSQGATAPSGRRLAATPARTPAPTRGSASPARPGATAARERPGAPRTLEPIHIEGEIPVPQVLFITAREQRRFVEFQHRRYLRTSRQLGEAVVSPDWIIVNRDPITPEQEKAR